MVTIIYIVKKQLQELKNNVVEYKKRREAHMAKFDEVGGCPVMSPSTMRSHVPRTILAMEKKLGKQNNNSSNIRKKKNTKDQEPPKVKKYKTNIYYISIQFFSVIFEKFAGS